MFRRKSRKRTVKGVLRHPMATKKFERALERATDQTLLETDWDAIIECVDLIRGKEVPAKPALQMIRKKIHAENPHTALHALHVLEATVKNCGERVHSELASREVMEDVKNLAFDNTPEKVKEKVLELMQCWAMAFANKPEYKLIVDTHNLMKLAGCEFPSIKESDAMFAAAVAPDWVEGDECYRCRTAFGILTRKHHCRACGQIFCDKCSSKSVYLPQFGIEKLVRVCDACFDKTSSSPSALTAAVASSTASGTQKTDEERAKAKAQEEAKRLAEQEEEELQLALAISQSEAEAKAKDRERARSMGQAMLEQQAVTHSLSNFSITSPSPAPPASQSNGYRGAAPSIAADEPEDPLARYLNREYWQARHDGGGGSGSDVGPTAPSAPLPSISLTSSLAPSTPTLADPNEYLQRQPSLTGAQPQAEELMPNAELDETLDFCRGIKSQVDTLTTRIRSNALRGRSLLSDPSIQTLFTRLTERHGEVLARLNNLDQERTHYEHVQDLVGHIHEAREAMNYLREEHAKQEAERLAEEKRRRDIALQQQLAHVRTLKQEMLVQQRNTALQRFQQQELEMQARRAMAMGYGQPGYPPQISQGMPQMPVSSLQNLPVTSAQQYGQQPYAPQQQQQQVPPPQHQNGYAPYPPSTTGYPPQQPPAYTASAPGYYQPQPQHQQQQQPQQPLQEQQNLPQQQIHQQHAQAYGYPPQGYQAPQQQYQQPLPKEQPQPVYNQQPQIPQQQHQQQQYYQQPAPGALPYGQPPQNNMQQQYQVPHQPAPPPVVEEASLISFD